MHQPLHRLQRVGTAFTAGAPGYTYDKYHKAQKRPRGLRLQTALVLLGVTVVLGGLFVLATFHLMPTTKIHLRRTLAQDGAGSGDASGTQASMPAKSPPPEQAGRDPGGPVATQPAVAGHQQLGAQAPPTATAGERAKGEKGGEDHYIPALKADVESLIAEATAVARERGIQTDTDAAAAHQSQPEHPNSIAGRNVEEDAQALPVAKCKAEDCQPHGTCEDGSCRCVALYTGRHCGHALRLSWPLFPEAMKRFQTAYDGEIILSRRSMPVAGNITVYQPDDPSSETESEGSYKLVANATSFQELYKILPEEDLAVKGHAYLSCAVVGSSGSLLQESLGPEIDSHHLVLRFNTAPTTGWEEHVGGKTNVRLTDMASWGWHEQQSEVLLVHTTTPEVLEGLAWNLRQAQPWNVLALNPDFESYMAKSFAFKPSTGLYGVMLALHSCRSVTVYGFLDITRRGAPVRYYDACDPQDAPNINATENTILKAFAEAGVLRLGESCAIECLDAASPTSDRLCQACKDQKGLRLGDAKCDGKKAKATERRPWVVPWAAKQ